MKLTGSKITCVYLSKNPRIIRTTNRLHNRLMLAGARGFVDLLPLLLSISVEITFPLLHALILHRLIDGFGEIGSKARSVLFSKRAEVYQHTFLGFWIELHFGLVDDCEGVGVDTALEALHVDALKWYSKSHLVFGGMFGFADHFCYKEEIGEEEYLAHVLVISLRFTGFHDLL